MLDAALARIDNAKHDSHGHRTEAPRRETALTPIRPLPPIGVAPPVLMPPPPGQPPIMVSDWPNDHIRAKFRRGVTPCYGRRVAIALADAEYPLHLLEVVPYLKRAECKVDIIVDREALRNLSRSVLEATAQVTAVDELSPPSTGGHEFGNDRLLVVLSGSRSTAERLATDNDDHGVLVLVREFLRTSGQSPPKVLLIAHLFNETIQALSATTVSILAAKGVRTIEAISQPMVPSELFREIERQLSL